MMNVSGLIARKIAFQGSGTFTKVLVWISIVSVALSVSVMIASMAVITGFNESITSKIFGFWGHIHITDASVSRSYEPVPIKRNPTLVQEIIQLQSDTLDSDLPLIKHVQEFAFIPAIINSKSEIDGVVLKGLGGDYDFTIMKEYLQDGEIPNVQSEEPQREIVLSQQTANRINATVGSKVVLVFIQGLDQIKRAFKVSGIYKTGLEEYDVKFAMVDIRNIQELLSWSEDQIAGYEIFTNNTEVLPQVADRIYEDILPNNLYSETIREKFPAIFDWLDLQKINEQIIIALMLLVCIINMATIVLIVILERRTMIGLLKSLGAAKKQVRNIFLYYAFWILGIGLLIGNVLALAFCWIQKNYPFIRLDEENYYVSDAPIAVKWFHVLGINTAAIVIVLFCMTLPVIVANRISPIKVLRFQ